ncbi:MAG TPA: S9 family peptidase [Longimicrobiales bacterium]|nr:S9 family peptidase [Longimicrobiales bacterium]
MIRAPLAALVLLFTAAAALPTDATAQERSDRLTLDTYLNWEGVANPRLSPDGTQVLYTRRWVDPVNDRWQSSVWIMNADGTRQRYLIDGSSAEWSPDGTRIAYTADGEPSGSQIFVRWMDAEGATSQVTRVAESPSGIAWSPDGESIAFSMFVPEKKSWSIPMPSRPEGASWTESPRIIESLDYRQDRRGFDDEGYDHIFVVTATGGTPRQLTSGAWDHGSPQWTPDGRGIVFSTLRTEDAEYAFRESEVYRVDVESGMIAQLTDREGADYAPLPSPDGRRIAYVGYDWSDDTFRESILYVMNADGSDPRPLTAALDRSPNGLMWAEDNSGVYFNVSREGVRDLHFAPLRGSVRRVTEGNHMLSVTDIRGRTAVGTLSSPHEPGDVVAFDLRRPGDIRRLTEVNDDVLRGVELGAVEELWWESVDDFRIQGWVVKPPDFDPSRRYPLMLAIHGGPHAMYNVGFNFGWQEHAANGYVVLYTNPRGSSGYGSAFGNAIKNAYPGKDFDDLMAGVDAVIDQGYVDTDNMFVYGCSGGGVLTAWVVGHTDRFRAASSNCPVINWLSFVGTTDSPNWYHNFEKLPWEDPSEHLRRSPLMYVHNVTTPTMLMTGERDLRTPITQTEEFYQALKVLKVPTAMVRFNEEWHGTGSRPSNFMRTQLYLRHWFERWGDHDDDAPAPAGTVTTTDETNG